MKHIKPIFEYEDDEIRSLMGSLETVGQGPMKGWLITVCNQHGLTTGEIVIADDWLEAQRIYDKNGMISGQGSNLASYLATMKSSGNLVSWDILDGFRARAYTRGYKKWDMANPYYTTQVLNHFFTNPETIINNLSVNKLNFPPQATEMKEV